MVFYLNHLNHDYIMQLYIIYKIASFLHNRYKCHFVFFTHSILRWRAVIDLKGNPYVIASE